MKRVVLAGISGYKRFVSPLLPPSCRFEPSCSAYAYEAIETWGVIKGSRLAIWRLARCNPFCKGGYDPVPTRSVPADTELQPSPSTDGSS
jgi:hypothetical protein